MRRRIGSNGTFGFLRCLLLSVLGFSLVTTQVYAGDNPGDWRPVYDLVMRWVNFFILAFVLVKFGKAPLMNFLKGQKEKTESEIRRLEKEKELAVAKVDETKQLISDSQERFERIRDRIVVRGEEKKQAIIEDARRESVVMIEDAKRKIEGRLHQAKANLKSELVEEAIAIAKERLAGELTTSDNEKITARFLEGIEA